MKPWKDEDIDRDPALDRLNAEPIPRLNGVKIADPLDLWKKVSKTDRAFTKDFKRTGGFQGTAIHPLYTIHRATELWGPMGAAWGVEILNEEYVKGAPAKLPKVDDTIDEIIHVVRIRLRYPGGSIEQFGQTTFVGVNKWGAYTDEEAPKKSLTDATTKALSWLGFSADVHSGSFDDNKHISSGQDVQFRDGVPTDANDQPSGGPLKQADLRDRMHKFQAGLVECEDETELDGLLMDFELVLQQLRRDKPHWWWGKKGGDAPGFKERIDDRRRELTGKQEVPDL